MEDVKETPGEETQEQTTEQPTEEEEQSSSSKQKKSESVPYDRFQKVIDQNETYRELLSLKGEPEMKVPATPVKEEGDIPQSEEEAITLVRTIAREEAMGIERRTASAIELSQVIAQNPDFSQHKEAVATKIKENPTLRWTDALKLVKYDASLEEAQAKGEATAREHFQGKQKANVETSQAAPERASNESLEDIDPMARDPKTGKFLHSLEDIEGVLPDTRTQRK
jgi:hypothetical protein